MYEFATGLLRVLEKRIVDKTDIDRMVLAKNANQAFAVLNDTDYANNIKDKNPEDYEKIIQEDFEQLKSLLLKIVDKKILLDFLFLEFDFVNLKALLKISLFPEKTTDFKTKLNQLGLYQLSKIKKFIKLQEKITKRESALQKQKENAIIQDNTKTKAEIKKYQKQVNKLNLEKHFSQSIRNIIEKINHQKKITPKKLDLIVDQEMLNLKKILAQKLKADFIKELLQTQIDFLNIKILLRFKENFAKNKKLPQGYLTKGGIIPIKNLKQLWEKDHNVLYKNLNQILEGYQIEHVIQAFKNEQQLWKLEKELDQFIFDFVKINAKKAAAGPEVIVAYFFNKINALKNIRIIMSSKLNQIPTEEIKSRIII